MKIYTKGGDAGQTGLFGGQRIGKHALRVSAYGDVDELNSVLGLARAHGLAASLDARVERVQAELFTLGAELATPQPDRHPHVPRVRSDWVTAMEQEIDAADAQLTPLKNFILPGGTCAAAWLHFARTVCRRAEREVVALANAEPVDAGILVYLNRLSDWLFTMARLANHDQGVQDPVWHPDRSEPAG